MRFQELYRKTFSQVHSSTQIQWEEFENMRRTRRRVRPLLVAAVVVCLLIVLSAVAVAADFLGLRQILLPEKGKVNVIDGDGVVVPGEVEFKDFISLAGLSQTPESRALAEWQAFLDGYDQDGSILAQIGNEPTGFEEEYGQYEVYTQEMADKLDEIAERYGLKLHRAIGFLFPGEWETRIGRFLGDNATAYTGYAYEDGTFNFDGDAMLPEYGLVDFQFRRSVRGSLDGVTLNVGDVGQYETWGYQSGDGTPVTLALSSHKGLILADLGDCFVSVNVLAGTETPVDDVFSSGPFYRENLESLADSFDLSVLSPVEPLAVEEFSELPPEAGDEEPEAPEPEEDPLYVQTGIQTEAGGQFIISLAQMIEEEQRQAIAELLVYPAQVTVGETSVTVEGPEEFLDYYDDTLGQGGVGLAADLSWDPEPFGDGSGLAGAADGAVWFGLSEEEGAIRVFTLQTDQWSIRAVR